MTKAAIQDGSVVNLSYSLKDSEGKVLDEADAKDPFVYLHGASQIVPGLEAALVGLNVGDKKAVDVSAEEGYGLSNSELKLIVNREQFPEGVEVKPGMQFQAHSGDGNGIVFVVSEVDGDKVHIDGNHPLAGQALHFDVEVLSIRDATDEEKEHGHAHGPEGHHHH